MNKEIEDCLALNKSLKEHNLVKLTWGNASVLSEDGKSIVIKPSGVNFSKLTFSQLCKLTLVNCWSTFRANFEFTFRSNVIQLPANFPANFC